jgi:hypothetical protein
MASSFVYCAACGETIMSNEWTFGYDKLVSVVVIHSADTFVGVSVNNTKAVWIDGFCIVEDMLRYDSVRVWFVYY